MRDIHARVAEDDADLADHAGAVEVARQQNVATGRKVGEIVIYTHDALLAPGDRRREDVVLHVGAIWADTHRHEVRILLMGGGTTLRHFQPPLLRHHLRVHQIDMRLGDWLRQPL